MFYQRPQTKNTEYMVLTYNNITGYYEGKIEIKETSESGIWKISWIEAEDIYDNQIEIHNSNVYDFYEEILFSPLSFPVYSQKKYLLKASRNDSADAHRKTSALWISLREDFPKSKSLMLRHIRAERDVRCVHNLYS